ncbi:MAG: hypothetical protein ACI4NA_05135 [Succinivibrio sp.]
MAAQGEAWPILPPAAYAASSLDLFEFPAFDPSVGGLRPKSALLMHFYGAHGAKLPNSSLKNDFCLHPNGRKIIVKPQC